VDQNLARQAELAFERQGDYDTLCYEGIWHTSGQMADRGSRLATGLAGLGVRPGDRLLVLMANCPEVLITYTAAWRVGAVVTPLIFLVSEDELRHALNDSGAVGIVTTAEFLPKVSAALDGSTGVRFVLVPGAGGNALYWYRVEPLLAAAGYEVTAVALPNFDGAYFLRLFLPMPP